jgi:hypothetical protein
MPGIAESLRRLLPSPTAPSGRRVCALLVVALSLAPARADDLASRVAQANTLMQQGKPQDALAIYSAAAEKAGPAAPAELIFNRACALLATDQIADAEAGFRAVLARAANDPLRAAAGYNLGLLESKRADAQQGANSAEAIDTLRRAERLFRSASAPAPDPAAAKNIDLVQRRIAALLEHQKQEEQQKKEPQNQQGQSDKDSKPQNSDEKKNGGQSQDKNQQQSTAKDQNLSDDLNTLADRQEQQSKQSDALNKQSEQGTPQDQLADQQQKAADQQKDLRDKTEQAKKQAASKSGAAKDQRQKDALNQATDKLDKAQQAQRQAEEKLRQGDAKSAEQLQQEAARQLHEAAQQAKSAEDAQQKQEQAQQQEADRQQQGKPFDATAAQILDQERTNKALRERMTRQRIRPAPVSKDW